MSDKSIGQKALDVVKEKAARTILHPLDTMLDEQLSDISSTIGSFIVRSVRGKFQRSISFTIGVSYSDKWMEEALYGILYQYNNIKGSSRLELANKAGYNDGSGMYYRLDDGTHNLKYRNYEILVNIQTDASPSMTGRINPKRVYTIITYNLTPQFVIDFERDMIAHRNSLLKIKADSPIVNVYQDLHESDGYTYWDKIQTIPKRRLGTIYLPMETKKKIVETVNAFFASKEYYLQHGIAHNLKILLYGPPGPQPIDTPIPIVHATKGEEDTAIPMGDINPGDKVFNRHGQPVEVSEIYEYDNLEVWEVTFEDGRKTKCASTHCFPIMTQSGNEFINMRVDQMINQLRNEDGSWRYRIPYTDGVCYGYDQKCDQPEYSPVNVIKAVDNARKLIIDALPGKDNYNSTADLVCECLEYDVEPLEIRQSFFRTLFNTMIDCPEIRIHDRVDDFLVVFPEGYFEGVIELMTYIANSLGISVRKIDTHTFGEPVMYSMFPKANVVNGMGTDHRAGLAITSIRNTGELSKMRCLHVDDPEHLYLTNDYLVTCNSGKDSIAKMIASEWNRNIYYVTGGKDGRFIPNAITDSDDDVNYPMMLISDLDKYPFLINEPQVKIEDGDAKEEKMKYKQCFGAMINALDGVLSAEGRIIVMTTNHIEEFSDTILRPGRIDLKLYIGYVTPEVMRKYVWDFYHVELPANIELKDEKTTIASMQADVVFFKLNADEFIKKYVK